MERDDLVKESSRSWVIAACCCFCNLTFYGISRLSGIMLVATTHTFHVTRASAAVPFSLSTAVRNLAGVFVGHLGHRFGVGPVVAAGCLIASVGSGLCFLAKDMLWLTVCWGGIFGFGFGLCTCLLPLAINQNFSKHLGTASGISYSGSFIGSFLFPPVVVWLLETFGLQGTYLIMSSGILNVLVAALLLMEPRKGKKKSISKSSEEALDTDFHQKSATEQPYFIEANEMWKRNIHMAYMASQDSRQDENKYKQNFRHSIPFAESPYFLQDLTYRERSPGNETNAEGMYPSSNILHSESNIHHRHLFPKLFRTSDSQFSRKVDADKASASQNISHSPHFTYDSSLTAEDDCFHSTMCSDDCPVKNVDCISRSALPVCKIPSGCSKKPLEDKLPFKLNLDSKFRLKLQKLKKVLVASLLKHKSPYLKEFVQTENVRLTSFRNLQPFLCPNAPSSFTPSKCLYLSLPQNILGTKSKITNVNSSCFNPIVTLRYSTKSRVRFNSLPAPGINGHQELTPVPYGSTLGSSKFPVFSEESHERRTSTHCCNASANRRQDDSCMFPPKNRNGDSVSFDIDSLRGSAPGICKNGCAQSCNILTLSPELFLKDKTELPAQKRRDSLSSRSKSPNSRGCFLDWLHMFREPVFVIIAFTMSVQTFIGVGVLTTIQDYATDIGIPEDRTHYPLMALSIADLAGTLTLGSVTDRGLISLHRFMFLCFLGMCLSLVAVSLFAFSLPSLLSLVVIYGLMEAGAIITFPLLTKQFVEGKRRQAIAIASSNVLSVPAVMLVPILIGHFRDNIGSYTGLFQLLAATSLTCSLLWLGTPSLCTRGKPKKKPLPLCAEKC